MDERKHRLPRSPARIRQLSTSARQPLSTASNRSAQKTRSRYRLDGGSKTEIQTHCIALHRAASRVPVHEDAGLCFKAPYCGRLQRHVLAARRRHFFRTGPNLPLPQNLCDYPSPPFYHTLAFCLPLLQRYPFSSLLQPWASPISSATQA